MQDLRNKNNYSAPNIKETSKDSSMLSSEESALRNRKRKNTIITVLAFLIFGYLSYKFIFKSNDTEEIEEIILPELETHKLESTVPLSELRMPPKPPAKIQDEDDYEESEESDPAKTKEEATKQKTQSTASKQEKIVDTQKTWDKQAETGKSQKSDSQSDQNNTNVFRIEKIKNTEEELAAIEARKESKKKSSIMLISGVRQESDEASVENNSKIKKSFDLNRTIAKGKIIDAVVEHSINTDYGGEIRAVITGNIFSEWGKTILIPQGSKIFGTYAKGVTDHTGRIFITWNRIDLPNGYQINFDGNAMDNLGIQGVVGEYDSKIKEQFTNAVLLSAFDIAVAYGLDKIIPPVQNSTQAVNSRLQVQSARDAIEGIRGNTRLDYLSKVNNTCTQVLQLIDNQTESFKNIKTFCDTRRVDGELTPEANYNTLVKQLNSELDKLLMVNNSNTEETQAQKASRDTYEDITDSAKSLLFESQHWEPTITIDQGAKIKIYTRQDYEFPSRAIYNKKRVTFIK